MRRKTNCGLLVGLSNRSKDDSLPDALRRGMIEPYHGYVEATKHPSMPGRIFQKFPSAQSNKLSVFSFMYMNPCLQLMSLTYE
jgi:hypothetical protein